MGKIDYNAKQHKSGLQYSYVDSEIYCLDDSGWVFIDITKPGEEGIGVTANLDMIWSHDDFEFEWEADGEPTYVDYGSTSVLYDSGEGGLESVKVSAEVDDYQFLDLEDPDIDLTLNKEQVLEILGCSEEDLDDLMKEVKALAVICTEAELEEYYDDPDNWPERSEYEPDYDYDDWRDVDWD